MNCFLLNKFRWIENHSSRFGSLKVSFALPQILHLGLPFSIRNLSVSKLLINPAVISLMRALILPLFCMHIIIKTKIKSSLEFFSRQG